MNQYREEIVDHYKNPRNFGEISDAQIVVNEANSSCGDVVKVMANFDDEKLIDIKWKGIGCAISTAAMSMLSEKVIGMDKKDFEKISEENVVDMLGGEVNPGRMKCALLGLRAVKKVFDEVK